MSDVIVFWKDATYARRDGKWFYLDDKSETEKSEAGKGEDGGWIGPFDGLQQAIDAR